MSQPLPSTSLPLKDPWQGNPPIKTRSELLLTRKANLLPDPSYDLDNDGHVSNLDLLISKRFDLDKDNKLNPSERESALNALNSGYLNNFKLGLESVGPNSFLRTIQKRGVIIENDDSSKILSTYPINRHSSLPAIVTRSQLLTTRKNEANAVSKPFNNVFRIEVQPKKPEDYVEKPKFTDINSVKAAYTQTLREKMGMTEPSDIKNYNTLGIGYVKSPRYESQTQMISEKKKEMLENLGQKANYSHTTREVQLWEREKHLISHNEGKTLKDIKEKQRLLTNDYNLKTFSNLSIGVHGKELPKFGENLNEYWKLRENYVENPKKPPKQEPELAKSPHVLPQKKSEQLTDKPNHIIPYGGYVAVENTDSDYKIPKVKYRMSTIVGHFLEKAAEMGINFLPQNDPGYRLEKSGTAMLDNSVAPISEIPRTSNSINKKGLIKGLTTHSALRTTGFIKPDSD